MPAINTNAAANAAVRYLNLNAAQESSSLSKLSSGSRITSASDDAAGLAISTRISSDVTTLQQAATNASAYRDYVSGLVAAAHKNNGSGDPNLVLNRLVAMQGAKSASFSDEEITFNLSHLSN